MDQQDGVAEQPLDSLRDNQVTRLTAPECVDPAGFLREQLESASPDGRLIAVTGVHTIDTNAGDIRAHLRTRVSDMRPTLVQDLKELTGESQWDTPPVEAVERDSALAGRDEL